MNPEVLILDDSLSAVDAKQRKTILNALKSERQGKTTMIATHRLSAIKHGQFDSCLRGRKNNRTWNARSIINLNGWYKSMYERQQLEELVELGG